MIPKPMRGKTALQLDTPSFLVVSMSDPAQKPSLLHIFQDFFFTERLAVAAELMLVPLIFSFEQATPTLPLLVLAFGSLYLRRKHWIELGFSAPAHLRRTVGLGLLAGAAYQVFAMLALAPLLREIFNQPLDPAVYQAVMGDTGALLIFIGLSWTLAAFGEEFVYRGYLFNRAQDLLGAGRAGSLLAVLVSAGLFGMAQWNEGWSGVTASLIFGIFLSLLYLGGKRKLWLPVLAHGAANTLGFILIYLGYSI